MDNIIIEKMTLTDLRIIKDILESEFDDFWTYNVLKEEIENQTSKYIVAKSNDKIIGFAGIKIILNEADIMNIVVKKSFRNNGIGSLLLNNLILLSKKLNLVSISLEVDEKNLAAINLYKKFDFQKIGIRKKYYKNNCAILMSKKLN